MPRREPVPVPGYPCEPDREVSEATPPGPPSDEKPSTKNNPSRKKGLPPPEKKPKFGHLEAEVIQSSIRAEYPRFRACYEDALRRDPNIEGRVSVSFIIQLSGEVSDAHAVCPTLADHQAIDCVVEQFRKIKFPPPEGGGVVTVFYPIMFSPGE